jgi:small-conductance mechanosensitive channel
VRDTPRAALQGFLDASRRRDFETAAHYMHLWGIAPSRQKVDGPELAQKLADAMERAVWVDVDQVPDTATGSTVEGAKALDDVRIASVEADRGSHTIRLARMRDPFSSNMVWVFSASTVRSIDALDAAYGLPDYAQKLPTWMREHKILGLLGFQWLGLVALALAGWIAGAFVERPVIWVLRRIARRANVQHEEKATAVTRGLVRWLIVLMVVLGTYPTLRMSATASLQIGRLLTMGIILVVMVGALRLVRISIEAIQLRHVEDDDPTRVRSIMTRLDALRRVAQVLVVVVGVALALMQFPTARTVGLSLLGSAGIAGAILGFAAQKTFANLFAGILISFTQPVRIGDTVVVEKEYGQIELIGSTHVVVRIWDNRRLVVPVTYFLDNPFENWTKTSPELWGTVFLHADYGVDVDSVRAELDRLLDNEPLFDGQAKAVLVTDVTDQTAVLRVTVSAKNAGDLWDLRCKVREKLLAFLHGEPKRLPRRRVETLDLTGPVK